LQGLDFFIVAQLALIVVFLELVLLYKQVLCHPLLVVFQKQRVCLLLQSRPLLLCCLLEHEQVLAVLLCKHHLLLFDLLVNLQVEMSFSLLSHLVYILRLLLELLVQHAGALLQLVF